jgi:nucleotide-binding universal stress UspA family protein
MVKIKRILIPTDGSDSALVAAEYGLELGQSTNALVFAIHVFDLNSISSIEYPNEEQYIQKISEGYVNKIVEMGEKIGVKVEPLISSGDPAIGIIDISQNYDLIVMGTLGRTGLSHAILGSVAEKVVRLSKCPVLVVK